MALAGSVVPSWTAMIVSPSSIIVIVIKRHGKKKTPRNWENKSWRLFFCSVLFCFVLFCFVKRGSFVLALHELRQVARRARFRSAAMTNSLTTNSCDKIGRYGDKKANRRRRIWIKWQSKANHENLTSIAYTRLIACYPRSLFIFLSSFAIIIIHKHCMIIIR